MIGGFPSAAAGLVVPAIVELSERPPELSCVVCEHEPEDGIPLLRSGELDVLVSETYEGVEPAPAGGLESHPLMSEPLLLVLPNDHAGREPLALESLRDARWIAGLAGTQFAAARAGLPRGGLHPADRPPRGRRAPGAGAGRVGDRDRHAPRPRVLTRGAGMMLGNSVWQSTLQRHISGDSLARVSSYDWFGSFAFYPLGLAIWGPVAGAIGIATALWIAFALFIAGIAAQLALPDTRELEASPTAA